jgi:hypothetical protein
MNIKKFHQINEKDLSAFDDDLDLPPGFKVSDYDEKEDEEIEEEEIDQEDEDFDQEAMDELLDLLKQLLDRSGIKDFYIFNDGLHIHIQVVFEDTESIDYISQVLNAIEKIEKETLTQYESELEMWKSKENEPVLEVSFFYEPNKKEKKKYYYDEDDFHPFY